MVLLLKVCPSYFQKVGRGIEYTNCLFTGSRFFIHNVFLINSRIFVTKKPRSKFR